LAAATVVTYGGPERNLNRPLGNAVLHRWSLTVAADNDTHATGLSNIVETAITGTRTTADPGAALAFADGDCTIASVSSAGVVTFSVAGSTNLDLLVWAHQ
jgi:hypothetical protein